MSNTYTYIYDNKLLVHAQVGEDDQILGINGVSCTVEVLELDNLKVTTPGTVKFYKRVIDVNPYVQLVEEVQ